MLNIALAGGRLSGYGIQRLLVFFKVVQIQRADKVLERPEVFIAHGRFFFGDNPGALHDLIFNIDGTAGAHRNGYGIAGPRIDIDFLSIDRHDNMRIKRIVFQIGNHHAFHLGAKLIDDLDYQVMG